MQKRSDELVDLLVASVRDGTSEHDKSVLRKVLNELVRVSKAEAVRAIEEDLQAAERAASSNYRPTRR